MVGVSRLKRKYRIRSPLEIVMDMLELLRFGSYSRWSISIKVNVPNQKNKEYFTSLTDANLIRYNPQINKYRITRKGLILLQCIKDLLKMLEPSTRGKENGTH